MYNFLNMFLGKTASILLAMSILLIISSTEVLASDLNLPTPWIAPNNYLLYSLNRLSEKVFTLTKISKQSRVDYYKDLTSKRLAELKYVVENKLLGEVQQSSQRFSYQIGTLSDYIKTNQNQLPQQKTDTKNQLNSYFDLLSKLRDKYPANSSYWLLIQQDIDSLKINLEKLK